MARAKTRKGQKAELDKIFSQFIRQREADASGYTQCVTCKRKFHWKDLDAGHFVGRRHLSTRYDERNVWPQCRGCNRFRNGNLDEYALFLLNRFGQSVLDELNQRKHQTTKMSVLDYEHLIRVYKDKLENIGKDQCQYCGGWFKSLSTHQGKSECVI